MSLRILSSLAAGLLVVGCSSGPETKVEKEGPATVVEQTGPGENVKTTMVTGVVTKYDLGKEIAVRAEDGNDHDFQLDEGARVEGTVEIGKPATIHYTESGGKKQVTVVSAVPAP